MRAIVQRLWPASTSRSGKGRLLSLDELRLYIGDEPDLKGYDSSTHELAGLTAFYDMDADGDNYVLLNAKLSRGSGSGDMFLYVPESTFVAAGVTAVTIGRSCGMRAPARRRAARRAGDRRLPAAMQQAAPRTWPGP